MPGRDSDVMLGAAELLTPRLALMLEALGPLGTELLACLGQLDPSPGLSSLSAQATLEPLLPQLSAEARAEVMEALRTRGASDGRHAVEAAFVALIARTQALGVATLLPGLIDAALKKHPRAQETEPSLARWAVALLSELDGLLAPTSGFPVAERALLYRVFPRICDVPAHEAFAAFHAVLAAQSGASVDALQRRIQALKLQRRVTLQSLAPLLSSPRIPELEA